MGGDDTYFIIVTEDTRYDEMQSGAIVEAKCLYWNDEQPPPVAIVKESLPEQGHKREAGWGVHRLV